jgi:hypothetical protein
VCPILVIATMNAVVDSLSQAAHQPVDRSGTHHDPLRLNESAGARRRLRNSADGDLWGPTLGRPLSAGALSCAGCRPSQSLGLILLPNALVNIDAAMARFLSSSLKPGRRTVVRKSWCCGRPAWERRLATGEFRPASPR